MADGKGAATAGDEQAVAQIRELLTRTADLLSEGGARDEALAELRPSRRVLLVTRGPSFEALGRVWRLGAFLLSPDATLRATGSITRAVEPGYPGHVSVSAEQRREVRGAAFNGPFTAGETVNYNAPVVTLDADELRTSTGPLFVRDGRALVRWSAGLGDDAAMEFAPYFTERAELLLHPPQGA